MPLREPPVRSRLWGLASVRLSGRRLWRCHRAARGPWWFGSVPPGHGRFDLAEPEGAAYLGATMEGAVLEGLQGHFGRGAVLPASALRARAISSVRVPAGAPPAVDLTASTLVALGATAALWAGQDRPLTQRWATALHGAGHQAAHHGIQHDPAGALRAFILFDRAGAHAPWGLAWPAPTTESADAHAVVTVLTRHGINVTRSRPTLPVTR